ncbi:hypothetical protein BBAD15_g9352 [Beauveria bassiana D1-5]|uniref:Uncharacterized protein n=1 Tax=Beauveria bassiana D1-5 TaxID=1245745 RepID=A0A0A2VGX7_BEABA|nr:hypothetical protein BBAD15_g9352 [Beauveria bassiana D1-5]
MAAPTEESSTRAAAPAQQRLSHPPSPDVTSDDEAVDVAAERSTYPDQDDVQAVLQPAMSRAASHLTSIHTPAVEKVAAMERMTGFFETPAAVAEDSNDDDDAATAMATTTTKRPSTPPEADVAAGRKSSPLSMPAPFNSQDVYQQSTTTTTTTTTAAATTTRTQHTKSVLGSSLCSTRHQRSGSAGQDALKRFQKVLPSFGSPSSFLPSLPTKYLNNLADSMPSISIGGHHATRSSRSQTTTTTTTTTTTGGDAAQRLQQQQQQQPRLGSLSLRRTASDESILYHTLSRQSSLGDDDRFHDPARRAQL